MNNLNPHLPIRHDSGGSLAILQLANLFDLLSVDASTPLYAGWWNGYNDIDDYVRLLGEPFAVVLLVPTSDLEWHV